MTTENTAYLKYKGRYPLLKFRQGVWREIVRYIRRDTGEPSTVIELGSGYCDFINQFPAGRKIAFELNPEMAMFAAPDVELHIENAESIGELALSSADMIFASNFLEHLNKAEHDRLMPKIYRTLKQGGRLILIQPNYSRCAAHYFDDETHQTIFSDENIKEFLEYYGFTVTKLIPGFLPFSMKTRLPKWSFLTRLYLLSPIKPMAAQMYVVAERR